MKIRRNSAQTSIAPDVKNVTLTDGASITPDADGTTVRVLFELDTIGGNRNMNAVTNQVKNCEFVFRIVQDGTGSRTLAWNANYLFPAGTDIILSTDADAVDLVHFISDGTNAIFTGASYNVS